MQIQFLGATGTVTGSNYLLKSGSANVLIDCGLFQGDTQLRLRNWAPLPIDPREINAVLLTRAHLDHHPSNDIDVSGIMANSIAKLVMRQ